MVEKPTLPQILNGISNRIRLLEGKQAMFNDRLLVTNKNMIEEYKKLVKEIKAVDIDLAEIKKDVANLKDIIKKMSEEIGKFAKKEAVDVLEKYINMWNPMNFVTETEVKKLVKKEMGKGGT